MWGHACNNARRVRPCNPCRTLAEVLRRHMGAWRVLYEREARAREAAEAKKAHEIVWVAIDDRGYTSVIMRVCGVLAMV